MTLHTIGIIYISGFLTTLAIFSILIGISGKCEEWGIAVASSFLWPYIWFCFFFFNIGILIAYLNKKLLGKK